MKRFAEQLNKKAASIKLRATERRELRDRLVSYMEYHPLPAELRQTKKAVKQQTVIAPEFAYTSEAFTTIPFNWGMIRNVVGLAAIILVIGVPVVAERSVPGDVLYPVKVQFNEEVRGTLALSPYAQVEWETERLERRLSEARLLASEGKLTDEVEAGVTEAIKSHSKNAKANIEKIRAEDADEAAIAEIAFASALAVQSEVLAGQAGKEDAETNETDGRSVASLASVVAEESRVAEATQAGSKPGYAKLLARVEQETTKAYELFTSVADVASSEEVKDIERRLSDIEYKVSEAITLHDGAPLSEVMPVTQPEEEPVEEAEPEGTTAATSSDSDDTNEVDVNSEAEASTTEETTEPVVPVAPPVVTADPEAAVALLREVLADARKLISFMTNIDVRENVNIESLVPVTLTNDEKIALIKNTLREVTIVEQEIARRAVAPSLQEKFAIGDDKLDTLVTMANASLAAGELKSAQEQADEGLVVAADLFAMTSAAPQLQEEVTSEESEPATTTEEVVAGEVTEE